MPKPDAADAGAQDEEPRAAKTTMPPPYPVEGHVPKRFGKVAEDVPEEVTSPILREEPPWPAEEPIVREEVELEPGGDPAMRARRYGNRGTNHDRVAIGEQFMQDQ